MRGDRHDVIVIGAGLAGTSAACALAADGYRVAILDTHAAYPHDFRAEKLGETQMAQFDRLGLGPEARSVATAVDAVWIARFQRLLTRVPSREYGLHYADLVNGLRTALPSSTPLTIGRVAEIETGPDLQSVVLSDGRHLEARLVVLTTGLGDVLRRKVGIAKRVLSPKHSVSFGFDFAAPAASFPFPSLTLYGDAFGSRIAYVTIFPIGRTMRGNLFVYHDPADPWVKAFRADPEGHLRAALPGLTRYCPDLTIAGPVEMRPVDLVQAQDYRRDGVVLLGDSFLSPCPIPGTGIGKVLTDVERFRLHLPHWLATPGMGADKIAGFYDDPVKTASDAQCIRASLYARALAVQDGPAWTLRRWRNFAGRHVLHALHRLDGRRASRARPVEMEASAESA